MFCLVSFKILSYWPVRAACVLVFSHSCRHMNMNDTTGWLLGLLHVTDIILSFAACCRDEMFAKIAYFL